MDLKSNKKYASLTIASGALVAEKPKGEKYTKDDIKITPVRLRQCPDSELIGLKNEIEPKWWDHT